MSAPQFTSGPWTVTDNSWETSTVYCNDGNGIVAECPIDNGVDELTQDHLERVKEANARLIAAAPELYGALERVWDAYWFDPSIDSSIWQEVQAALAKARGETL